MTGFCRGSGDARHPNGVNAPAFCALADDTDAGDMKKIEEIATTVFAAIGFGLTLVFVMLFVGKVVWWTLH